MKLVDAFAYERNLQITTKLVFRKEHVTQDNQQIDKYKITRNDETSMTNGTWNEFGNFMGNQALPNCTSHRQVVDHYSDQKHANQNSPWKGRKIELVLAIACY